MLIGPNGAGKSNLLTAFELLAHIHAGTLVASSPSRGRRRRCCTMGRSRRRPSRWRWSSREAMASPISTLAPCAGRQWPSSSKREPCEGRRCASRPARIHHREEPT
ncbi:MAG: ATP-binding protein [Myxococcales bacterium]|nr:ATP-binding protein [Myxococcales bacterium]